MGRNRVELFTSSLSETRSTAEPTAQSLIYSFVVEPVTPTLSGTRSTTEPCAQNYCFNTSFKKALPLPDFRKRSLLAASNLVLYVSLYTNLYGPV